MGRRPTLNRLAGEAGLTGSHFHRVFKRVMGVTPGGYAAGVLRERAAGTCDAEGQTGKGSEVLLEDGSLDLNLNSNIGGDWDTDKMLFQPGDQEQYADFDAWLAKELEAGWDTGLEPESVGADLDVDDSLLWNDFDALIAAEADLASRQDPRLDPLTGAPGLVFDSDSPGSGVSHDLGFPFVGV
ncbi:hypothetical protein BDV06DRAFT_191736 [Aspergillus oleicola]